MGEDVTDVLLSFHSSLETTEGSLHHSLRAPDRIMPMPCNEWFVCFCWWYPRNLWCNKNISGLKIRFAARDLLKSCAAPPSEHLPSGFRVADNLHRTERSLAICKCITGKNAIEEMLRFSSARTLPITPFCASVRLKSNSSNTISSATVRAHFQT